jgi:LacI family transcriptional regulator
MKELYDQDIPVVMIDFDQENICNITSDNQYGVDQAIKYLKDLNHKKIATIHGTTDTFIGNMRLHNFLHSMKMNGLTVNNDYLLDGKFFTKEDGFNAMNRILDMEDQPTAIFCASDMLAIGAIQACKRRGKSVPRDFSIVGFDGIDVGQLISPLLTTVKQDTEEMGKKAAKQILKMIADKKHKNTGKTIMVKTTILEGETTKAI